MYEEKEEGLDYMQSPLLEGSVEYNQTLGDKIKNDIENKIDELKAKVNNHAYEQQEAGQLEPYLINVPLHISKEELEELEEKLKRRRMKRR